MPGLPFCVILPYQIGNGGAMSDSLGDRVVELATNQQHLATKADVAEAKVELIKWMVGLVVAVIAIQTGLIIGLFTLLAGN